MSSRSITTMHSTSNDSINYDEMMHRTLSNINSKVQPFRFDGGSWNHHDLGLGAADIIPPGKGTDAAHFEYLGMSPDVAEDGHGVFLHSSFPNRSWVCGIKVEPAGKDDLEKAEFSEALRDRYAAGGLETVRLYRV